MVRGGGSQTALDEAPYKFPLPLLAQLCCELRIWAPQLLLTIKALRPRSPCNM